MYQIPMGDHDFRAIKAVSLSLLSSSESVKNDIFCNTPIEEQSRVSEHAIRIEPVAEKGPEEEEGTDEQMFSHLMQRDVDQRYDSPMNHI
jgi:hypothetical protein